MGLLEFIGIKKQPVQVIVERKPIADYTYVRTVSVSYNGEKTLGEMGQAKTYLPDYDMLRVRSWQSFLDSEVTQMVLGRFTTWMIGTGLKLQCQPDTMILQSEGINLDSESFNDITESRFQLWAKSLHSSRNNTMSLHSLAKEAYKNAIVGGDVLVILRYENGLVTTQLVDGCHVQSPGYGSDTFPGKSDRGNDIRYGIEINSNGKHVGYYVRNKNLEYDYIPAYTKSGVRMAFMVYGLRYRLENTRGLPLISAVLATLKKLERYKEATVGSAEERQKIAFAIEHNQFSDNENPLAANLAKAINVNANTDSSSPTTDDGVELANNIAVTTQKAAFNMGIGQSLKMLESKNELYFKDFYTVNIDLVCACIGIPPNVAMSKYDSNFSASRAALKDWEHTLNVGRDGFSESFYNHIYAFFLHVNILDNKIQAPGYLSAFAKNEVMTIEAFRRCRFVGANVPHIDPVKEVEAERRKLGDSAAGIPLTTVEAATEALNGGDSDHNMIQFSEEYKQAEKLGIQLQLKQVQVNNTGNNSQQ